MFSGEFYETFKNTFFIEHLRWLLLKIKSNRWDNTIYISTLPLESVVLFFSNYQQPFCLIQSALSFWVPHPVLCSTRLCPCFWILVHFHTQPINSYLSLCRQFHLPSADLFLFSRFYEFFWDFRDFSRFYEILDIFHFYFQVLRWRTIFVFYGTQIYVLIIIITWQKD